MLLRSLLSSLTRVVLLAVVLVVPTSSVFGEDHIRIGSFNIAEFGEGDHHESRKLPVIAKMLVDQKLDLVALQEVGVGAGGNTQVAALRKEMNKLLAQGESKYFYFVTPQSGDERCAVIYRYPVVMDEDVWWLDDDKVPGDPGAGGKTFYRVPVALSFTAGNFDFAIVIVHLAWGNLERREDEVEAIKEFLEDDSDPEKDWIVLGDFNRYGKYGVTADDRPFDELFTGNWEESYRFPLLEAVTPDDPQKFQAATDELSTTVAQSKNMYDQFIITSGAANEFATVTPTLGQDVGIIAFDREAPFAAITDHNEVKYTISDHRPIWMQFRTDLADDD